MASVIRDTRFANCTLDRNSTGVEVFAFAGETLHIKDCVFSKNTAGGIRVDSGTGQVLNYYNGFWANGAPGTRGSPGDWNLYYYFRQPFYVSGSVTKAEFFVSRDDTCAVYMAYEGQGGAGFSQAFVEKVLRAEDSRDISFKKIDVSGCLQPNRNHVQSVKVRQYETTETAADLHFDAVLFIEY